MSKLRNELALPAPDNAEVRLRVKAIGLNRAEVHFRQGRYRFPPVLPSKIGMKRPALLRPSAGMSIARGWGKLSAPCRLFLQTSYGVYGEVPSAGHKGNHGRLEVR